jgi:hypothetical protein
VRVSWSPQRDTGVFEIVLMRQAYYIVVGALVLATATASRADLSSTVITSSETTAPLVVFDRPLAVDSTVSLPTWGPGTSGSPPARDLVERSSAMAWNDIGVGADSLSALAAQTPLPRPADREEPVVRELPPGPGSGALAFAGLLPLGMWGALRSHRFHLGSLPAWYHPSAPDRIGHAVAYDFDYSLLPLCRFDSVCESTRARPGPEYTRRDAARCPGSQYFLPVTAPRGPPLHIL